MAELPQCPRCEGRRQRLIRGLCKNCYQRAVRAGEIVPGVYATGDRRLPPIPARSSLERMIDKIAFSVHPEDCWHWLAGTAHGYGHFENRGAHRTLYEILVGPVEPGMVLDHLCRNRACVNPAHLEPVTPAENVRRGVPSRFNARKTHCPQGHPYSGDNLLLEKNGYRLCRACRSDIQRKYRIRKRGAVR